MFQIFPVIDGKRYRITVVPLGEYNLKDRYLIRGGSKEEIIYNNRPLMRKNGIIHSPVWEIENKTIHRYDPLHAIGREIEKYMRENGHWDF